MKERPIIFSGPMVRAILDGTKTQTRRLVHLVEGVDLMDPDELEPQWPHDPDALPLGAIVGTAVLAGVVRHSSDPWFAGVGAVGWVLEDVRACEPIPCRGAQGLWEVPADIAARLDQ